MFILRWAVLLVMWAAVVVGFLFSAETLWRVLLFW